MNANPTNGCRGKLIATRKLVARYYEVCPPKFANHCSHVAVRRLRPMARKAVSTSRAFIPGPSYFPMCRICLRKKISILGAKLLNPQIQQRSGNKFMQT